MPICLIPPPKLLRMCLIFLIFYADPNTKDPNGQHNPLLKHIVIKSQYFETSLAGIPL